MSCIDELQRRCAVLEKERDKQTKVIAHLESELQDKVDKSLIYEYLVDPEAARVRLNKEMGLIEQGDSDADLALATGRVASDMSSRKIETASV